VADVRILQLIRKWLKAGVLDEGQWKDTELGAAQGAVLSPLFSNICLHYVFDLWVDAWRKKCARGDVLVVRYADDTVLGFQHRADADRFLVDLQERLGKFGLELNPDKTRRIEFGLYAERNRRKKGRGKPDTFDFLGFTPISGKKREGGFVVKRKTVSQRMRVLLRSLLVKQNASNLFLLKGPIDEHSAKSLAFKSTLKSNCATKPRPGPSRHADRPDGGTHFYLKEVCRH